jgi:mRNA interferase MazF
VIRGAVYPVELGDAKPGHEQRGRRLGLVISLEQDAWSTVTILPTSTSAQASVFRPEVVIAGRETKILIDQIRTIDVSYIAGDLVDYLSRDDMAQVEHSLSRYFGLLRWRARRPRRTVPRSQRPSASTAESPAAINHTRISSTRGSSSFASWFGSQPPGTWRPAAVVATCWRGGRSP